MCLEICICYSCHISPSASSDNRYGASGGQVVYGSRRAPWEPPPVPPTHLIATRLISYKGHPAAPIYPFYLFATYLPPTYRPLGTSTSATSYTSHCYLPYKGHPAAPMHLFTYLPIHLFAYLPISYLPICIFAYLPIYLFTTLPGFLISYLPHPGNHHCHLHHSLMVYSTTDASQHRSLTICRYFGRVGQIQIQK